MFSSDNKDQTTSPATAPVQAALTEIRLFATQLQEMTALFAMGRNDMARQLEAANQKMESATNAISMGEARIAAQIAAFEQMTNDARRATEEHDRAMRSATERMHQAARTLEADAVEPIKLCAESILRSHDDAVRQIDLSQNTLRVALDAGAAKLAASSEALDAAAGTMAQNVLGLLEGHNASSHGLVSTLARLDQFMDTQTGAPALSGERDSANGSTQRLDDAARAIDLAASKIVSATIAFQQIKQTPSVAVQEQPVKMAADLPELDVEREAMKRLTVGYRMMMRDVGKESQRLEILVGTLENSIAALDQKAQAALVPAIELPAAMSASESTGKLANLDDEKTSFQRLSVGFRLLLQDIGSETERLRNAVDGIDKTPPSAKAVTPAAPVIHTDRIESLLEVISRSHADMTKRFDEMINDKAAPVHAERMPDLAALQSASSLPNLSGEKDSLQRILVGFRLLLKEISQETGAYRARVAEIKQPDMLVLAPTLEPELLAPLNLTAERIAEGIAETLSMIEQKLSDPLALLNTTVSDNIAALKLAHATLAESSQSITSTPLPPPSMPSRLDGSVADAVKSMERAATLVDQRIGSADQLLTLLKKGGAMNTESLRDLVTGMDEAARSLRHEAGDLLAIGASLSHDLTSKIAADEDIMLTPRRARTAGHVKKRMF